MQSSLTTAAQRLAPRLGRKNISCRASAGFTFIEVLLATVILGTMLVAASTSISGTVQAQSIMSGEPVTALGFAREIHSLALVLPHTAGDGTPATTGSEVAVLDDLDGAQFTPPIDAAKQTLTAYVGWSQQVLIESVDLASPDQLAASPGAAGTLLRLTVTVRQGGSVVGTYVWWINP